MMHARTEFDVAAMITMFDGEGARSRSHGLRPEVIGAQADRLRLPQISGLCTWDTYDAAFARALQRLPADVTHVVFGDILFEHHRRWAESICAAHGLTAVEPLFGVSTERLFTSWLDSGGTALIVTARSEYLDASWLGRPLAAEMVSMFERLNVDPCGERGEYHTVVTDCDLFAAPIAVQLGATVHVQGCWAVDVTVTGERPSG
jgi:uncharacterized protein (TIGR00290 family)